MSYILQDRVFKESKEKLTKKLLLMAIASYASGTASNNEAYPSQGTLAKDIGVGERQIGRLVKELVKGGELEVTEVGNGHRSTRYHLIFKPETDVPDPLLPPPPPPSIAPVIIDLLSQKTLESSNDDPGLTPYSTQDDATNPPNQLLNPSINQIQNTELKNIAKIKNVNPQTPTNSQENPNILTLDGLHAPKKPENLIANNHRGEEDSKSKVDAYRQRLLEAMARGSERERLKVRADLRWVPEDLMPYIDAFVQASKIIPIRSDQAFWIKEVREQIEAGLRPRDITEAVAYAREQAMTIKSPKSITTFARNIQAQKLSEKEGFSGSSRNSDGSYNL